MVGYTTKRGKLQHFTKICVATFAIQSIDRNNLKKEKLAQVQQFADYRKIY